MKKARNVNWDRVVFVLVFAALAAGSVYAVVHIATAPAAALTEDQKAKSDYVLTLFQCMLGLVAIFLPTILAKRFNLVIPRGMTIAYTVFLYCAIYLGEVRSFYYRIPHWDTVLHAFSGGMLGLFGFIFVSVLNKQTNVNVRLSPLFESVFAFCFALSVGAIWEIYEFTLDGLLGLNSQKYMTEAGELLVGRDAVSDTMGDLISDCIAAFAVTFARFVRPHRKRPEPAGPAEGDM